MVYELLKNELFLNFMVVVVFVVVVVLAIKYKINLLNQVMVNLVLEAENYYYGSGKGKEKLEFVVKTFKLKLPLLLRILPLEKLICSLVEKTLTEIKCQIEISRISKKEIAKSTAIKVIDEAIKTEFKGNYDVISNNQLIDIRRKVELDTNSYIQGELSTDFKDDTRFTVKAGTRW